MSNEVCKCNTFYRHSQKELRIDCLFGENESYDISNISQYHIPKDLTLQTFSIAAKQS